MSYTEEEIVRYLYFCLFLPHLECCLHRCMSNYVIPKVKVKAKLSILKDIPVMMDIDQSSESEKGDMIA